MSGVQSVAVLEDETGLRLDRWFKRHFPDLGHGRLEKLLRTGQVRLDGKRVRAGARISAGQVIRVPPVAAAAVNKKTKPDTTRISDIDADAIRSSVLYMDNNLIALNKAPGLAVQGGSGTSRHVDAMLDALSYGANHRPRLVHRLDKDTSGVLLIARSPAAASHFAEAFRSKRALKVYWALVAGIPELEMGVIEAALRKGGGTGKERMYTASRGKSAATNYMLIEAAGDRLAWLLLQPETGRTHQLRVHCAAMGTPILGDGKYGGRGAFLDGADGIARKLHLHARWIRVFGMTGEVIEVTAPLPEHMKDAWKYFGFEEGTAPLTMPEVSMS
ncbi:MAG: RluA family pseudouridine synthase [Rhodospirillales bacterium]|jgi:23S rRNA pseudouridine955/2504/2580 synthase|nr:RluA family pseudouridine synthase [Rhodospirillales bacterium]MDP6645212.1 RluA family pseudouridine synthase [Rhodospirillales bacterium]MDP6840391.1 RluA family pseudouridine synthase [Rhodospirillales bacterium]